MEKSYSVTAKTETGYTAWISVTAKTKREAEKIALEMAEDLEQDEKSH